MRLRISSIMHTESFRYIIAGVLTTIISLSSYYLCVTTFLNPDNKFELQIANIISWIFSVSFAYVSNRIFVFHSKQQHFVREILSFFTSRIATLLLDMGIMFVLVSLASINDKLAKILVQFIVFITNYILSKFLIFKQSNHQ